MGDTGDSHGNFQDGKTKSSEIEQEIERKNTDLRTIIALFGGRLVSLEGQSITLLFR